MFSVFFLTLSAAISARVASEEQLSENPIRRIVTLLQKMAEEVEADGKKDEDLSAKFECYCKTSKETLTASIAELGDKVPQLQSEIKETEALATQLDSELAKHKKDREEATGSIDSATAQREKEAESFAAESAEMKANIGACGKAIDAISKGMSAMFLQSNAANALKEIVISRASLDRYSRGVLTAFFSTSSEYSPASGEIVGILKQLLEDMEKELADATATENDAIATYESLVSSKEKEIAAATASIESKTERAGETAVKIVSLKNDLEDSEESFAEDQQFVAELEKTCATKKAEYEERVALRAQESVAIAETIKVLNDDDALDLFKKTLPSTGLLLFQNSMVRDPRQEALTMLQDSKARPQLELIALALKGKKVGFEKVIKMIDDMVVLLGEEMKDDEAQKEWCLKEADKTEDKTAATKRALDGLEVKISETSDAIETLASELDALANGIKALDKAVAEATEQRKEESVAYTQTAAENNGALQLLEVAKNRLNKFYNPALYVPPPKRELTADEKIFQASGGELPSEAPLGGIAGTGVTVFAQVRSHRVAPPPPPATAEAFTKKDSSGPIALIDSLKNDLEKDMQANDMDEKESQKDYEELMKESAAKRATDSKTITEKESQKAGLEGELDDAKTGKTNKAAELMALKEYAAKLHGDCSFLIDNFDARKAARANEVDALKKAKAVLSGADYSLLEVRSFLSRRQ